MAQTSNQADLHGPEMGPPPARPYHVLGRSPFLGVTWGMNRQNRSDLKVGMVNEIDMSSAVRLRRTAVRKPSYTALVVRAVALALRRHPEANRLIMPGLLGRRLVQLEDVDIAVAVERDGPGQDQAASVAIVRGADGKDPAQITDEMAMLARPDEPNWRALRRIATTLPGWLAVPAISLPGMTPGMWTRYRGGSMLISSPAKYGVDCMVGHWLWPHGVSFGLVKERPWVADGQLVVRPTMHLTLSFNRCIIAGGPAARLMATISALLTDAEHALVDAADQPAAEAPGLGRVA